MEERIMDEDEMRGIKTPRGGDAPDEAEEMPEYEPHYLLLVDRKNNTDTMELQVEVRPEFYSDEINRMVELKKKLSARLQSVLGLSVNVRLVEPRSIERSVGKAKRVIDNRKL